MPKCRTQDGFCGILAHHDLFHHEYDRISPHPSCSLLTAAGSENFEMRGSKFSTWGPLQALENSEPPILTILEVSYGFLQSGYPKKSCVFIYIHRIFHGIFHGFSSINHPKTIQLGYQHGWLQVIVDSTLEAALDQKLQAMRDQARWPGVTWCPKNGEAARNRSNKNSTYIYFQPWLTLVDLS